MDMIEVVILLVRDPFSSHTEPNNVIRLLCSRAVADLGGVPRVPWNPPFGFSCDRKLWKPGLQQNPTI